jgi:integrase
VAVENGDSNFGSDSGVADTSTSERSSAQSTEQDRTYSDLSAVLAEMNAKYAVVQMGGKTRVMVLNKTQLIPAARYPCWLTPKQAFAIFKATAKIKAPRDTRIEFRILLRLLCYTGMRLGEALGIMCNNVNLEDQTALLPVTKNRKPSALPSAGRGRGTRQIAAWARQRRPTVSLP